MQSISTQKKTPSRPQKSNKVAKARKPVKQAQSQTMKQATRGMTTAPVAMTKKRKPQGRPKITRNPDGSIRVQYKEFVADISATPEEFTKEDGSTGYGASPFETLTYDINPGNEELFKWFSIISKGYEMYQVHKMGFEIDPVCPTTTQGSVMLATDFDAFDDPPFDKQEMMAMKGAQRCAPWESCRNSFTGKDLAHSKDYYIRDAPPSPEQDITLLDVGKFILSTVSILGGLLGSSSGDDVPVGELYVDYDITLKNPTAERNSVPTIGAMRLYKYPETNYSYDIPFGDNPLITQNTATPIFDYDDITGEFTCNKEGQYLFLISCIGPNPGISHNFVFDPVSGTPVYDFWNDIYIPPVPGPRGTVTTNGKLQCAWWFKAYVGDRFTPKLNGVGEVDMTNVEGFITPIDYDLMHNFSSIVPFVVPSPDVKHNVVIKHPKFPSRKGRKLGGIQISRCPCPRRRRRM